MGWSAGAGFVMLMLLALSACASFLAILRFFMRSDQTHVARILGPAIAACLGFGVFATLRLVNFSTIAFETLALGTLV